MAKVLTKSQVVAHLAEKVGIQKKAAAAVLEHRCSGDERSQGRRTIRGSWTRQGC